MRRGLVVAFAIVATLLAITSMPVSAQNASALASQHTTFGTGSAGEPSPTTLQNMSVEGSGPGASVGLDRGDIRIAFKESSEVRFIDADGNVNVVNTAQRPSVVGGVGDIDGDNSVEIAFTDALDNLKFVDAGGNVVDTGVNGFGVGGIGDMDGDGDLDIAFRDTNKNVKFVDAAGNVVSTGASGFSVGGVGDMDGDGDTDIAFQDTNDNVKFVDSAGNVVDTGRQAADVGGVDDVDGDGDLDIAFADTNNNLKFSDAAGSTAGTTAQATTVGGISDQDGDGDADIVFRDPNSNLKRVDAAGNVVNTGADTSGAGGATVGIAAASASYVGARHDAENVNTGFVNLTLSNADATVRWQEDADGDGTFTNVSTTTYTTSGNKTADLSGTTSDRWRVRVGITTTGSNPTAQINDEGVLFASASPALSDAEPPDQAKIKNAVGNVSINVSDPDFGLVQGDTVTVSATDDDGTSLGSTTVTSDGRASLPYTSENGQNVIDWSASDEYGNTDTFRQTFTTPSTLIIRNESAPSQVINTSSNVTVTFFDRSGQNIIKRSSSNGRIDLSGIPTDTEYVIQVDAAGFRSRQVIITSLFDQQNVYLLPTSRAAATVEFQLNDQTSRFPSDRTTLFIQKPITRNNSTEFRTVFADQFGATDSLRVDLRDQERYRIKVRNDQGETRVLESFTTAGDAVAPLTIGSVEVSGSVDERGVAFASDVIERDGARLLRITYQDPAQQTAEITVQVRQNGSQVVPNITGTAGYGRFVTTVNITGRSTAEDYNVTFEATRDGQTISGGDVGGGVGELSFGLDPFLRQLIGWGAILALTGLVVIRSPRLAPATGTLTGTMLTIIGVLTIPAPALGIAGAISVLSVYSRGGGA